MTAERYRVPPIRGARTAGYGHHDHTLRLGHCHDGNTPADLFGSNAGIPGNMGNSHIGPHPDFLARAAIWKEQAAGLISIAEARRRSAGVGVQSRQVEAIENRGRPPVSRPRHTRPAPNESRQYAQPMATTAARDDRLTPNAKAFLQVLRARCGKGRETTITKGTAGAIMSRSPRTIRRYLVDLARFGYLELETRKSGRGLHLGLIVRLSDLVAPFYEEAKGLARWLAEAPAAAFRPFEAVLSPLKAGVTLLTPKNQPERIPSLRPFRAGFREGTGATAHPHRRP